jgi:hydroxylamine reductase (hybrid-cluster protein)
LICAGKFRIFDQDFGMLPGTGLPRLLDMGQCNDAYSALVVATVSSSRRSSWLHC